jgi:hypothetical protein
MSAANEITRKAKFDRANAILLDKNLKPAARLVGWYIADHINTKRGYAWPPQEAIARDLGIDERTVRRSIKCLAHYFAIDRSRRQHEYRMTLPDNLSAITPNNTGHFVHDAGHSRAACWFDRCSRSLHRQHAGSDFEIGRTAPRSADMPL